MKLSVKGLAVAGAIVWGGGILLVGLGALIGGAHDGGYYGQDFLLGVASIYPGYHGTPALSDTLLGAAYGLIDGAIGGGLLAWIHNLFAPRSG